MQMCGVLLNDILNYIPTSIDIPLENIIINNNKKTSKYYGVSYDSKRKYFVSSIKLNNKTYCLGNNINEIECAKLYNQQALYFNKTFNIIYLLNDIPNYVTIEKNIHQDIQNNKNKSSKFYGVCFNKSRKKFKAYLVFNKKQIVIGEFINELDAMNAYNLKADELNKKYNKKYKLNEIN